MVKNWIFGILLILLLILIGIALRPKKETVNWAFSLNSKDKIPLGTHVFFDGLSSLFPKAKILKTNQPIFNQIKNEGENKYSSPSIYFLVNHPSPNDPMVITPTDIRALIHFAEKGNIVFLASSFLNQGFSKLLGLEIPYTLRETGNRQLYLKDSTYSFKNSSLDQNYPLLNHYFELNKKDDNKTGNINLSKNKTASSKNMIVLGYDEHHHPNFIRIDTGKGTLFFHSCPEIFTNYFLLTRNNADYLSDVLSYIPQKINTLYWDEYYQTGAFKHNLLTPLDFIFSQSNLRLAALCMILFLLLFGLFQIKRRERMIPWIPTPKNKTLEFIETMGFLYLEKKDNRNLALKMILQCKEYLRTRYTIGSKELSLENAPALGAKMGLSSSEITDLIKTIHNIPLNNVLSDQELLDLNKKLQTFYR